MSKQFFAACDDRGKGFGLQATAVVRNDPMGALGVESKADTGIVGFFAAGELCFIAVAIHSIRPENREHFGMQTADTDKRIFYEFRFYTAFRFIGDMAEETAAALRKDRTIGFYAVSRGRVDGLHNAIGKLLIDLNDLDIQNIAHSGTGNKDCHTLIVSHAVSLGGHTINGQWNHLILEQRRFVSLHSLRILTRHGCAAIGTIDIALYIMLTAFFTGRAAATIEHPTNIHISLSQLSEFCDQGIDLLGFIGFTKRMKELCFSQFTVFII